MAADWGTRLMRLAQGIMPSEKGVTPVMRRNGNFHYVSEMPVVTPVTPVTSSRGAIPKEAETGGVTAGVTLPEEVAERAAIMEADGGLPPHIALALARLELNLPTEMIDTLARFVDEWGIRSQALGWTVEDLFGAPPARSLASVLQPGSIVLALSSGTANVRHASGEDQLYGRTGRAPTPIRRPIEPS
jgi:hypothetical protein